jgi:hypothetical protein
VVAFDHNTTGFQLTAGHQKARCDSCHINGVFRGTPKDCASCHMAGGRNASANHTLMPNGHIAVGSAPSCDSCHVSSATFQAWRMNHTVPAVSTAQCGTCHSGQSFLGVIPPTKSANHVPTTSDCSACHSSTQAFGPPFVTRFDHVNVAVGSCETCHNGGRARGKMPGHIQTIQPCDLCHKDPQRMPGSTFAVWAMDHSGIVGGCANCHNGQAFIGVTPMSRPTGHVPVGAGTDCSVCHLSTTVPGGFAIVQAFTHPSPLAACATCHNGTNATGKATNHLPTNATCDTCHLPSDSSFAGAGDLKMNHQGITTGCATCHNGQSFVRVTPEAKGATHIPTAGACELCHSVPAAGRGAAAAGDFLNPAKRQMNHTGITSGCATCHAGNSFAGVTPKAKSAAHIPTTVAVCETCHASTLTATGDFARGQMNHVGIGAGCAACHDNGRVFAVTSPALVTKPATGPPNHIATTQPCEVCHSPAATAVGDFASRVKMNHVGIIGDCNSCHTGQTFATAVTPRTQSPGHVLTGNAPCSSCHTNTTVPGGFAVHSNTFDHVAAGVRPGSCTTCHNGTSATGQIAGHIVINAGAQCDACHSYTASSFATWTMDHSKVTSSACTSCHAAGKTFPAAVMVTIATPALHIPVGSAECSTCHSSTTTPGGFATWRMEHAVVAGTACATCHDTGKSFTGTPAVVVKPATGHIPTGSAACDTCHTSTTSFKTWTMDHAQVAATSCATCHDTGRVFMASTPPLVLKPSSGHIPIIPVGRACNDCHTSTASFAVWTMNHTGITAGCQSCHGTTTQLFPGVVNQVSGHIATAPNRDCVDCHTSTVPGGFGTFTGGGVNPHTAASPISAQKPLCTSCHGVAGVAPGQITGHIAVNSGTDCGSCHDYRAASFATFTMSTTEHSRVSSACSTCHAVGKSFPGTVIKTQAAVNHIPTGTTECSACHTSTANPNGFATWTQAATHANTTLACSACHGTGKSFTGVVGIGSKVGHVPIGGADCGACHGSTVFKPASIGSNYHATSGAPGAGTCLTCHGAAGPGVGQVPGHVPATASCDTCHTSTSSFTSWQMGASQHSAVAATPCATCHDTGKSFPGTPVVVVKPSTGPGGHIPTAGVACDACHSSTSNFTSWTMNHAVVSATSCATCHDSDKSFRASIPALVVKPTGLAHIPILPVGKACNACHTSTNSFTVWTMDHSGITSGCQTCHGTTTQLFPGVVNQVQGHINTASTPDCVSCHASTAMGGFGTFTGSAGNPHTAATPINATYPLCTSCHGVTAPGQVSGHITVNGGTDCGTCHDYKAASFATFTMSTTEHTKVSAACSTCHANGKTFPGTVVKTQAAVNHIPTGSTECSACHTSTANPNGFSTWTQTATHANTTASCASCHGTGKSFAGVVTIDSKVGHIPIGTADCSVCHGNIAFRPATGGTSNYHATSGQPAAGSCLTCHGPAGPGLGQVSGHITATAACDTCHTSTASFTPWQMGATQHASVAATACSTCHDTGKSFPGTPAVVVKPASGHIPTGSVTCNTCHTSTSDFKVWTMNHAAVTATSCATCHDTGKVFMASTPALVLKPSSGHIPILPTGKACDACHKSTTSFTTWTMDHTGITSGCQTCHGTTTQLFPGVVNQVAGHISTASTPDCVTCHSSTAMGGFGTFTGSAGNPHTAATPINATYPLCTSCHGVTAPGQITGHIVVNGGTDCGICHDYRAASFATFTMSTTEHTKVSASCSTCHAVGKTFPGTVVKTQAAVNHIPTGSTECSACHTSTANPNGFATPSSATAQATVTHANTTATCTTCHGTGRTFGSGTAVAVKTIDSKANHVAIGAADCSACHGTTTFVGVTGGATYHSTTGQPPPGSCLTCHGAGGPGLGQVGGHITATAACDTCHTSTASFTPWQMGVAQHTSVAATACVTCHDTGKSFPGTPATVVKPAGHITYPPSTACSVCHTTAGSSFAVGSFTSWSMDHSVVTATACATCHDTGKSFPGTPAVVVKPTGSAHIPLTGLPNAACNVCHKSTTSFTVWTMDHTGITSGCQTCHGTTTQLFPGVVNQVAGHINTASTPDCVSCHSSTAMGGFGTFTGSAGNPHTAATPINATYPLCTSCHGVTAPGQITGHITVNSGTDCGTCHDYRAASFATFTMSTTEHTKVSAACSTCHANGKTFPGTVVKTQAAINHIPTGTTECSACHTSTANPNGFATPSSASAQATVTHANTTATCTTCHGSGKTFGSGTAVAVVTIDSKVGHIPIGTADCNVCHGSTVFKPATGGTANYHATSGQPATGSCLTCHGASGPGLGQVGGHIPATATCDTCHTSTSTFQAWQMGVTQHTSVNATACLTCHDTNKSFPGTPAVVVKPASGHIPTGSVACDNCHTSTTNFKVWTMNHASVSATSCATCHDTGKVFLASTPALVLKPSSGHIPILPSGKACDACHKSTTSFTVWTMDHTGITSGCQTCHGTATQLFPGVVNQVAGHINTASTPDCVSCHSSTAMGGFGTFTGSAGNPHTAATPINATYPLCTSCHGVTAPGQIVGHITVNSGTDCGTCHDYRATSFATFTMSTTEHTKVSAACSTCHAVGKTFPGTVVKTQAAVNHIPTGTTECSACHTSTANPNGFATPSSASAQATVTHANTTLSCSTCHGTGRTFGSGTAVAVKTIDSKANHVPIGSTECNACHGTSVFTPATGGTTYHASTGQPAVGSCLTCHGVAGPGLGQVSGHIVASAACDTCHTSTSTFTSWQMGVTQHGSVAATACATCHDTGKSFPGTPATVVKPSGHILTGTGTCNTCHTSAANTFAVNSFTAWTMDHAVVTGIACATCHDTGKTFPGTPAVVVKPSGTAHIPLTVPGLVSVACNTCHTSTATGGFASWTMANSGHSTLTANCNSCHAVGAVVGVKTQSTGHISTAGKDCSDCHGSTQIPGGFSSVKASIANPHPTTTPINATYPTCATCHNGTVATGQIGGHIATSADCGTCHDFKAASFTTFTMGATGHAVATGACETCHGAGMRTKWPGAITVTIDSVTHIAVTGGCQACHGNTNFTSFARNDWPTAMKHTAVTATPCASCHGASKSTAFTGATIKTIDSAGVNHIPVTGDCSVCHDTANFTTFARTWTATNMQHSAVAATPCATCHGTGKSSAFTGATIKAIDSAGVTHIPVTGDCSVCHDAANFTTFARTWTATNMQHSAVATGTCANCHGGQSFTGGTIRGLPIGHIAVTGDCASCHNNGNYTAAGFTRTDWATAMNHSAVNTASCQACHNANGVGNIYPTGVKVLGKGDKVAHVSTASDCGVCHTTTSFKGASLHDATSAGKCGNSGCHDGATPGVKGKVVGHIASGQCDNCHTYAQLNFANWTMNHTDPTVAATACGTCHTGQSIAGTVATTVVGKPVNHITVSAGVDCKTCHTNTTHPGGFASRNMNHAGVNTTTCNSCHGGQTFATGVTPKGIPAGHISVTGDCAACHLNNNYAVGGFARGDWPTAMNHNAVNTATCTNCHNGQTFTTGIKPVSKSAAAPAHITTGNDCYTCHGYVYSSFKINPAKMNHAGILSNCQGCHNGTAFQGVTPKSKPATGHIATTTADCVPCHTIPSSSATASFAGKGTGWNMGTAGHGAVNSTTCINCHNGQTFTTGVIPAPKPVSHITTLTAATDCNVCHSNFNTFAGQGSGWVMNHTGVSTATCTNCHNNQTFANGVKPVSKGASPAHIATTADCMVCHSGTTTFANGMATTLTTLHANITNPTVCATCHGRSAAGIQFQGVKPVGMPTNHMIVGAATDCYTCHTNYTTFAGQGVGWTMSTTQHAGLPGTCVSCHTGQTFATGVQPRMKPNNHIPTTLAGLMGDNCSNCHSSTAYPNGFLTEKMNHGSVTGGAQATGCAACHSTNLANGLLTKTARKRTLPENSPSEHRAATGKDCSTSGCHRPLGNKGTPYTKWN